MFNNSTEVRIVEHLFLQLAWLIDKGHRTWATNPEDNRVEPRPCMVQGKRDSVGDGHTYDTVYEEANHLLRNLHFERMRRTKRSWQWDL